MRIAAGLSKITVPLKADEVDFASVLVPEPQSQPDVTLRIDAGGVPLKVTFKGKNFRKSVKAITPGCFVVIQGKLQYRSVRAVRCPTAADKPPMACRPMIWKTA